jgi:hypothetical protein
MAGNNAITEQKVETNHSQPYIPTWFDQVFVPAAVAISTVLGLPKLISLWGKTKAVDAIAERRRNDSVYDALIQTNKEAIAGLIDINKIAIAGQTSIIQELLQATATQALQIDKLITLLRDKKDDPVT